MRKSRTSLQSPLDLDHEIPSYPLSSSSRLSISPVWSWILWSSCRSSTTQFRTSIFDTTLLAATSVTVKITLIQLPFSFRLSAPTFNLSSSPSPLLLIASGSVSTPTLESEGRTNSLSLSNTIGPTQSRVIGMKALKRIVSPRSPSSSRIEASQEKILPISISKRFRLSSTLSKLCADPTMHFTTNSFCYKTSCSQISARSLPNGLDLIRQLSTPSES